MNDYAVSRCEPSPELFGRVSPDFIYNRFDLWALPEGGEVSLWRCTGPGAEFYFEALTAGDEARLGLWLTPLESAALSRIVKAVFREFPQVKRIRGENLLAPVFGVCLERNHFRIDLPETPEALSQRLSSKGRNSIKRKKRILGERFGSYRICAYDPLSREAEAAWRFYFEMKRRTHGTEYGLDARGYCARYHVTNVYTLELGDEGRLAAVFLSCEQCPQVYLENLSYDPALAEFSPGLLLYDEYLKLLIGKRARGVYLLGGDYSYKKRYGSIEDSVVNCTVYRDPARNAAKWAERRIRSAGHRVKERLRKRNHE